MNSDDFINPIEFKALVTLLDKEFDYDASLKSYTDKVKAVIGNPKLREGHWTRDRVKTIISQIIKRKQYPLFYQNLKFAIFDKELDVAELSDNGEQILVFANTCIQILPYEDCFDVLAELHRRLNHAGVDKMNEELNKHYYITKMYLYFFLQSCNSCAKYRNAMEKHLLRSSAHSIDPKTVNSSLYQELLHSSTRTVTDIPDIKFNDTVKIDFLNMTSKPDEEFQYILIYYDKATKYILLKPMVDIDVVEVAMEIFRIITDFGPPKKIETPQVGLLEHVVKILEITPVELNASIVSKLVETESNIMVGTFINDWMENTKSTNWATGCYIVQSYLNLRKADKPMEKLFGKKALTTVSTPKFEQNSLWEIVADKSKNMQTNKDKAKNDDPEIQLKDPEDDDDDAVVVGDKNKEIVPSTSAAKDSPDLFTVKSYDMVLNVCFKCKRPIFFQPYNCIACKKFYHYYCAFKSLSKATVADINLSILCYMCQVNFENENDDD